MAPRSFSKATALWLAASLAVSPGLEAAQMGAPRLGGARGVTPAVAGNWAALVRLSFTPGSPDSGLAGLRTVLSGMAGLDASDPATLRDLEPVALQLQAAAERLAPAEAGTRIPRADGEQAALAAQQLALLDHPILRGLLREEQRSRVSAAAAEQRESLSESERAGLDARIREIAESLGRPGDAGDLEAAAAVEAAPAGDAKTLPREWKLQAFLVRHGQEPLAIDLAELPAPAAPATDLAAILNVKGRVRMVFSPDNPHGGLSSEDAPGLAGLLEQAGVKVPVEQEKIPVDWNRHGQLQAGAQAPQADAGAAAPAARTWFSSRGGKALRFAGLVGGLALGWTLLGAWLAAQPGLLVGLAAAHGTAAGIAQRRADKAWRYGSMLRAGASAGLFSLAWLGLGSVLTLANPVLAAVVAAAPWVLAGGVALLMLKESPFITRTMAASLTTPKRDEVVLGVGTKLPPVVIGIVAWFTAIGLAHPILLFTALALFLAMEAFHGVGVNSWENFQNNIFRLRGAGYQLVFNWLYIQLSGAVFRTLSWLANPGEVAPPWSAEYWKDMLIMSVVGTFFGTLAYRGLNALYNNGNIDRKKRARIQQIRDFIMFSAGPLFSVGAMMWFWLVFAAQQSLDFGIYLVGLLTKKKPILYVTDPVVAGTAEFKTMYLERWTAKEEHPLKQALKGLLYGPILRPMIFLLELDLKPFVRKKP